MYYERDFIDEKITLWATSTNFIRNTRSLRQIHMFLGVVNPKENRKHRAFYDVKRQSAQKPDDPLQALQTKMVTFLLFLLLHLCTPSLEFFYSFL